MNDFFKPTVDYESNDNNNFIYLLKEREFVKSKEQVYKLGKTTKSKK